jgi:hypothetical protein
VIGNPLKATRDFLASFASDGASVCFGPRPRWQPSVVTDRPAVVPVRPVGVDFNGHFRFLTLLAFRRLHTTLDLLANFLRGTDFVNLELPVKPAH